ncbi:extensin-like [Homarus americanus]|uniref:extensin-like n=1 Tax=Homarus americanus TaxID=6706 RepID=UPI001C45D135|nr:extensin-like [Homarus americanus]
MPPRYVVLETQAPPALDNRNIQEIKRALLPVFSLCFTNAVRSTELQFTPNTGDGPQLQSRSIKLRTENKTALAKMPITGPVTQHHPASRGYPAFRAPSFARAPPRLGASQPPGAPQPPGHHPQPPGAPSLPGHTLLGSTTQASGHHPSSKSTTQPRGIPASSKTPSHWAPSSLQGFTQPPGTIHPQGHKSTSKYHPASGAPQPPGHHPASSCTISLRGHHPASGAAQPPGKPSSFQEATPASGNCYSASRLLPASRSTIQPPGAPSNLQGHHQASRAHSLEHHRSETTQPPETTQPRECHPSLRHHPASGAPSNLRGIIQPRGHHQPQGHSVRCLGLGAPPSFREIQAAPLGNHSLQKPSSLQEHPPSAGHPASRSTTRPPGAAGLGAHPSSLGTIQPPWASSRLPGHIQPQKPHTASRCLGLGAPPSFQETRQPEAPQPPVPSGLRRTIQPQEHHPASRGTIPAQERHPASGNTSQPPGAPP